MSAQGNDPKPKFKGLGFLLVLAIAALLIWLLFGDRFAPALDEPSGTPQTTTPEAS